MRVLLLADVHANWPALLALQRAEPEPDALLFAGDAVGYGPDASDCVRWLTLHATLAVRGNHDEALAHGGCAGMPAELAEAARETVHYARGFFSTEALDRLGRWPTAASTALGGARFHLTHGTPAEPLDGTVHPATCPEATLEAMFAGIQADVIVLGHTHLPAMRRLGSSVIINPGSLGQPRNGLPDATYAVWDDGDLQMRHLHYDHEAVSRRLRLAPLSAESVEVLTALLATGMWPSTEMENA